MYRKTRKLFAVMLTLAMVLTMVTFPAIASASTGKRLAGNDRYGTALSVAQAGWTTSDYAVLATGEGFADALCAAPLAKAYDAPILLTDVNVLNADVKAELLSLKVKTVYIAGGTGVVSANIEAELKSAGMTVIRLGGADRVETSIKIAEEVVKKVGTISEVAVANGEGYADALSIAPVAANEKAPILLVDTNSIPGPVSAFLAGKTIAKTFVVGGTGVVSDAVKNALPNAVRLGGQDRYDTNYEVLSYFGGFDYSNVFLATGENYPDALAGSAYAAKLNAPIVLFNTAIQTNTMELIEGKVAVGTAVFALGGDAVCAQREVDKLVSFISGLKNYDAIKASVEAKVAAYEALANGDLSTQAKIDAANAARTLIVLDGLTNEDTSAFNARIAAADAKVSAAVVVISKPSGISESIENPISNSYPDTVLFGQNATINVKVVDKNGKGVPGLSVAFTQLDHINYCYLDDEQVVKTDANGVAAITASADWEGDYVPPVETAALKFKAEVVGTELQTTGTLRFASIYVNPLTVSGDSKIEKSTNAKRLQDPMTTRNMLGIPTQYVPSQQVSIPNVLDHSVTFTAKPQLVLPPDFGTISAGSFETPIDYNSGDVAPYKTYTKEVTVPAGLKYATLNIASLQVAPYSIFTVAEKGGNTIKTIYGPSDLENFAIQLPVKSDASQTFVITLKVPGQVQQDLKGGVNLTSITGSYIDVNCVDYSDYKTVDLPGASIDWEKTAVTYSQPEILENPSDYIPKVPATLFNGAYTYYYKVPVFPFTGDAIITGVNANGEIKQYFVYPTVKDYRKNQNVLADPEYNLAILVTKEEAENLVGTITQDGFDVTVDSEKVGYTALKGTVNIPGYVQNALPLELENYTLFTSVQWAPVVEPEEEEPPTIANPRVYTLVGKQITATAQLLDVNGNPVANGNVTGMWEYTLVHEDDVAVAHKDKMTFVNGQAKIALSYGEQEKVVDFTATAPDGYKVVMTIGGDQYDTVDMYWVNFGIQYTADASNTLKTSSYGPIYSNEMTADANSSVVKTGKTVLYQYRIKGTDADEDDVVITGIPVTFKAQAGGVGSIAAGQDNSFTATSTKVGTLKVDGTMGVPTAGVMIKVTDADGATTNYKDVGTGDTSMHSVLTLPIDFVPNGEMIQFVNPYGTNIAQASTTVYALITDQYGNPLEGKKVFYTITHDQDVDEFSGTTDDKGLVKIDLTGGVSGHWTGIKIKYNDNEAYEVINWIASKSINVNPDPKYTKILSETQIAIAFDQDVNPSTLKAEEFTVTAGAQSIAVQSVSVDQKVVTLTLKSPVQQLAGLQYSIVISQTPVDPETGLTYRLASTSGATITDGTTVHLTVQ